METKHTPAPWKQDGLYIDAPDGSLIATVNSEDSIENEFNGKLIAAAPELLEALKECLERLEMDYPADNPRITQAKKAIKKATE